MNVEYKHEYRIWGIPFYTNVNYVDWAQIDEKLPLLAALKDQLPEILFFTEDEAGSIQGHPPSEAALTPRVARVEQVTLPDWRECETQPGRHKP